MSAFQTNQGDLQNYLAHAALRRYLEDVVHVEEIHESIGMYQRHYELGFTLHLNSSSKRNMITARAFEQDYQDAVLVRNNQRHSISIVTRNGDINHIGDYFNSGDKFPTGTQFGTIIDTQCYWVK